MQHLDEGTIHAWIDGELSPEQASEVEAHASACPECAAMVAEARGLVAAATRILTALDEVPGDVIPSVPDIAPAGVVRRRWYQRTDFRAAAALLFVAGASLLVTRRGMDSASSRAMLATADKGQAAPEVSAATTGAAPAGVAQKAIANEAFRSPTATSPAVSESPVTKPPASNELLRRMGPESSVAPPTAQSLQANAMADALPSEIRARDEMKLSKEGADRTRAANAVSGPPAYARADAPAPSLGAVSLESRLDAATAGSVEGRVTDKTSGQGMANAQVTVQGTTLSATTDKDGKFRIENVPAGSRRLLVRRIGYQAETVPLAIQGKEVAAANVGLAQTTNRLEEVVVTSAAVAPAPAPATLSAAMSKAAAPAPLRVVRADSTGGTKRTVYEVSRGVEVTLNESPLEIAAERDMAANDPARQKVAAPQSAAAGVDARQRENAVISGRIAGAVATPPSAPALPLNSISWTERGRKYLLTGRLTTKDLEILKARLMQMKR